VDPNDPLHLVTVFWEVISFDPQNPGNRQKRLNWAWTRDGGYLAEPAFRERGLQQRSLHQGGPQGNFYIETILVRTFATRRMSASESQSTDGGETFVRRPTWGSIGSWTSPI